MSDANVEQVRRIYESWNADGLDALVPWLADTVELRDAPEMPDATTVRGREAVIARLHEVGEAFGGGTVELLTPSAVGEQVLVPMTWKSGEEPGSAEFGDVFHVVRLEGEKIASLRVFVDETTAREAARG